MRLNSGKPKVSNSYPQESFSKRCQTAFGHSFETVEVLAKEICCVRMGLVPVLGVLSTYRLTRPRAEPGDMKLDEVLEFGKDGEKKALLRKESRA